jgi:tRNA (cmo5U34)-methyltransferase
VAQDDLMLMGEFFDHVSEDYDVVHMSHVDRGEEFYQALSLPVATTQLPVKVLDIGCGSGLELEAFFAKASNAHIHCIDLSARLMAKLLSKYADYAVTAHLGSYLTYEYPRNHYNYVLASSTLHHLLDAEKSKLFLALREALIPGGRLIVGEYYLSPAAAAKKLAEYDELVASGIDLSNGKYHFDVPTSAVHEMELLTEAGFTPVRTVWESSNYAVIVADKR